MKRIHIQNRRSAIKWFKHDSDAHADAKLERVRIKYGMAGYGLYWYCLELVARTVDKHNLSFELEHDAEIIAHRTGIHRDLVQEMMAYMVDIGLFESSQGRITCLKMVKRLDEHTQQIVRKLHITPEQLPSNSRATPNRLGTNSELKEEKRTEQNRTEQKERGRRFAPPTAEQVCEFVATEKLCIDPIRFITHYQSVGWKVGKSPMKDWKAAARGWHQRSEAEHANDKPGRNSSQDTSAAGRVRANVRRELDTLAAARTGGDGMATHVQPVRTQVG